MLGNRFAVSSMPVVIGRVVTATISLICVLIVYDGWADLRLKDVVLIVVGPVLAVWVSHVFAASLVRHVELGRRLTWHEWIDTVGFESRFLLLAVPPVALLVVLNFFGVSLSDAVRTVIWLEALSLGFWAGLAAHYAGFHGRSLALAVLAGLVLSVLVLGLEVLLEPGKADQNPSAATHERGGRTFPVAYSRSTRTSTPRARCAASHARTRRNVAIRSDSALYEPRMLTRIAFAATTSATMSERN
jgi:hypothetical protein